jgi:hypothetical protein
VAELSPAAQAVLDALYMDELNGPQQLMARAHASAALRAAAVYCKRDRVQLLAIADELEAVST